ncbi:prepilin-type N-terminal cleavage/methylation domain-containing protein [Patescibacteria group bacterium]|nr:MAG: prepilin-type N-terminal cleavage/methylation domain-containing protein [Patescibacteria group bacterium]
MRNHNKTLKGFTLVELLVVIAIIAILFAVVLVAINPAQRFKDSRNARRLSDVQSIVGAVTTYTADKRGTPPADIPDGQCIGAKPATIVSDSGPRAHWKFDEVSGSATDTAGGFTGTTSESYNSAKFNNGLNIQNPFGGASVAETIDDTISNALTLEGWIKLNQKVEPGTFDHNQTLFDKGNYGMRLNSDSGKLELETQNGNLWSLDYATSSTNVRGINSFVQFQGALYAGGIDTTMPNSGAVLLRKNGTSWSAISDYPSAQLGINALAVYNGKMYSGQNGGRVYVFDGSSWQSTGLEILTGSADVFSLTRYKGMLYAGLGSVSGASVWAYNGVSWSKINQFDPAQALGIFSLIVFNEKLYAGTGRSGTDQDARLFEFDGNSWTQQFTLAKDGAYSLAEYDKELYVGFGGNDSATDGVIYKGDGISFSPVGLASKYYIFSLRVFNGILFAGEGGNVGDGDVYYWNGTSWVSGFDNPSSAGVWSLYSYGGKLYFGGRGATAAQSGIWTYGSNGFLASQKSTWYPNVWYHIAGIYSGSSQMKIFINGTADAVQTSGVPANITANTQPLYLGIGYASDAFSGVIDDFAIHHAVVSDETIASHAGCYNLGQYLVSEYMGALPIDPSSSVTDGSDTGYFISKDPGGVVTITAPLTEITSSIPDLIKASR